VTTDPPTAEARRQKVVLALLARAGGVCKAFVPKDWYGPFAVLAMVERCGRVGRPRARPPVAARRCTEPGAGPSTRPAVGPWIQWKSFRLFDYALRLRSRRSRVECRSLCAPPVTLDNALASACARREAGPVTGVTGVAICASLPRGCEGIDGVENPAGPPLAADGAKEEDTKPTPKDWLPHREGTPASSGHQGANAGRGLAGAPLEKQTQYATHLDGK
jgi:hypothetical protein